MPVDTQTFPNGTKIKPINSKGRLVRLKLWEISFEQFESRKKCLSLDPKPVNSKKLPADTRPMLTRKGTQSRKLFLLKIGPWLVVILRSTKLVLVSVLMTTPISVRADKDGHLNYFQQYDRFRLWNNCRPMDFTVDVPHENAMVAGGLSHEFFWSATYTANSRMSFYTSLYRFFDCITELV